MYEIEDDYKLALKIQQAFDEEFEESTKIPNNISKRKFGNDGDDLDSTRNLVHPEWETLDPTPDIQSLFQQFDNKFFNGRLKCVTLEWSKRMYSCAGICYSRKNQLGKSITIRLSEPLLKLRTRKDLIETLLHEMIHAYCSVLNIREGNGGHGPYFAKIMNGINKVAGTNITVYHNFYDGVDIYKTHWWRCNGICKHRKPFFGFVKRTSNREPGPNDFWWQKHLQSCGGHFLKVRGPEQKKSNKSNIKTIKDIFPTINKNPSSEQDIIEINNDSVESSQNISKSNKSSNGYTSASKVFGDLRNVKGLSDIDKTQTQSSHTFLNEVGHCLTDFSKPDLLKENKDLNIYRKQIQGICLEKSKDIKKKIDLIEISDDTEIDSNILNNYKSNPNFNSLINKEYNTEWEIIDEDIMLQKNKICVVDLSNEDDYSTTFDISVDKKIAAKAKTAEERKNSIRQEIIESCEGSADEIEIIDDDFNDNLIMEASTELADTSLIDDLFGEDSLLIDFKKNNALQLKNSNYTSDANNDIISCPVCQDKFQRKNFINHLDGCTGISIKVNISASTSSKAPIKKKLKINSNKEYKGINNIFGEKNEQNLNFRNGSDVTKYACPNCGKSVLFYDINSHLDECLN